MTNKSLSIKAISLCFVFLISSACYSATPTYTKNTIHLYGNQVSFYMPLWQELAMNQYLNSTNKEHQIAFKTFTYEKGGIFILEQIPNDQYLDDWSTMYAIHAANYSKQTPIDMNIMINANKQVFKDNCVNFKYAESPVKTSSIDSVIITIFCDQIKETQEGEIMVKHITVTKDNQSIEIYQEWKGDKFIIDQQSTWPVTQSDIDNITQRLSSISIRSVNQAEP